MNPNQNLLKQDLNRRQWCDPLKILPSNGSSDEEEVYRQLIVERINDDDI